MLGTACLACSNWGRVATFIISLSDWIEKMKEWRIVDIRFGNRFLVIKKLGTSGVVFGFS